MKFDPIGREATFGFGNDTYVDGFVQNEPSQICNWWEVELEDGSTMLIMSCQTVFFRNLEND